MTSSCFSCASGLVLAADAPTYVTPTTSLILCILLVLVYVGSLYLSPVLVQKVPLLAKIGVAWTKILGTVVSSVFAIGLARLCIVWIPPPKPNCLAPGQILGLSLSVDSLWWDLCLPIITTLVMIAPLILSNILTIIFTQSVVGGKGMGKSFAVQIFWYFSEYLPNRMLVCLKLLLTGNPILHQFIIFGPLAEELTFRAGIISVMRIAGGWSIHVANLTQALLFSLSHAHDTILHISMTRTIPSDIISDLIQCTFTFLFALFSGHIFIRSRCIWTCIMVHMICNVVGFPDMNVVMALPSVILLGLGMVSGLSTALTFYLLRRL